MNGTNEHRMERLMKHKGRPDSRCASYWRAEHIRFPQVTVRVVSLVLLSIAVRAEAKVPDTYMTEWRGAASGAYSLTFESGMPGQWQYAVPILNERNLKGTFFLNGGSVMAWFLPNQRKYIHIAEMLLIAGAGHEIGSHAYNHLNLVDLNDADIRTQMTRDLELFHYYGIYPVSFAYPFSKTDARVKAIVGQYMEFARGGYPVVTNSNSWDELDPLDLRWSSRPDDRYECVELAIVTQTWAIGVFSSIGQNSHQNEPTAEEFTAFADYLMACRDGGDLWVDTVEHIASYIREKSVATITQHYNVETNTITIYLEVNLGHPYVVPLTLRTSIDGHEVDAVRQSEMPIEYKIVDDGSGRVVQYDAVPDGGQVLIELKTDSPNPGPGPQG